MLVYTTQTVDNSLRIARVAAAGRIAAERASLRDRRIKHDRECEDCAEGYTFCADYPRR